MTIKKANSLTKSNPKKSTKPIAKKGNIALNNKKTEAKSIVTNTKPKAATTAKVASTPKKENVTAKTKLANTPKEKTTTKAKEVKKPIKEKTKTSDNAAKTVKEKISSESKLMSKAANKNIKVNAHLEPLPNKVSETELAKRRLKVKTILITQPKPESDKSPFFELATKHKIKIDWRPFIHVEGIKARQFRMLQINLSEFTAIIFNSKNAIDHFFKLAQELRYNPPADFKYFCITESVALYLQKFIHYRKRKVFFGNGTFDDLRVQINRHKDNDYFLFPCSDIRKNDIPDMLTKHNVRYKEAVIYNTVSSNLSDLKNIFYDIIVFYSPADLKSVFDNFPTFKQNQTRIAAFGKATAQAVLDHKLILDIEAPIHETPSMSMAIEKYLQKIPK